LACAVADAVAGSVFVCGSACEGCVGVASAYTAAENRRIVAKRYFRITDEKSKADATRNVAAL
jgi:hypothetical protein